MHPTRVKAIQSSGRIAKHGTGMENPFLLAVALLESRAIAKPLLSTARDHKAASQMGVEKPINWQLLFDGSAQEAGRQDSTSNAAYAGCNSDRAQCSGTPARNASRSDPGGPSRRVAGFEDEDSDSTELAEVLPDEAFGL